MHYRAILVAAAQTTAFFLSGFFIPLLVWLVTPVPVILAYVRDGRLSGLSALGLAGIVTALLAGWPFGAFLLLLFGSMSVSVAENMLRGRKPEASILLGSLPSIGSIVFFTAYYVAQTGKNPVAAVEAYIREQRAEAIKSYTSLGFNEVVSAISAVSDESIHNFVLLLPCIAVLTLACIAACSYFVARVFIARKPGSGPAFPSVAFGSWHAPDAWVWGLIAALACFMLPSETAKIAGWNLLIPFAALYLIQGVAIVDYVLKEKARIQPMIRIIIHSIILSLPSILAVIGIGVIDIWADFRKLRGPVQKA